MKMLSFKMEIIEAKDNNYKIKISNDTEYTLIEFNPLKKELNFINEDNLTDYLKKNEYQIRKMLHNKRIDTYYVGFNVPIVLRCDKNVAAFNDRSKIVVLNKKDNNYDSYVIDKENCKNKIYKIYTDASYFEKKKCGGVAFIIEDLEGNYNLHTKEVTGIGSSQAELEAVIEAFELLKDIKEIRIITDSQYVRKGLTEWIPCWKLNGFKTVNGENVKNIENWLRFDDICNGKYIEFEWVKGHSNHFENSLCDMYAKDMAKNKLL